MNVAIPLSLQGNTDAFRLLYEDLTWPDLKIYHVADTHTAVLVLGNFSPLFPDAEAFSAALQEGFQLAHEAGANHLVIDLTKNGGGIIWCAQSNVSTLRTRQLCCSFL